VLFAHNLPFEVDFHGVAAEMFCCLQVGSSPPEPLIESE